MPKQHTILLLFILSLVASVTHTQDSAPHVIASHSILGDVVANVVGDVVEVKLVMPVGADPHSFEATPTDLTALAIADVVFVNGALYEEGLLEAIENAGADTNIIEASRCIDILPFAMEQDHDEEADEAHEDASTDALCDAHRAELETFGIDTHQDDALGQLVALDCGGDEAHDTEAEHNHEGECDPHVWMNPENVMYWTMLIRDTLIDIDPTREAIYRANADAYLEQLNTLIHDELMPLVETLPAENRILITNHDSLGYLAAAYDFELIGTIIPGGSTVAEPSVQDIARLIDLINSEGVPAVFAETTVNNSIAQTITDETGAQLVTLYSGSLGEAGTGAETYIDYIRYNYTTIVNALSN